ncbi:XRE family transcriptional regulator [Nocardioides guangzhouensis]|uniref:XRE family transcriptional regulator n=1 Tax=Nocardioides guangzhouensis TaxID=2497878 RepID=A0A4Q4ZK18_9ACTN|nr:helix-turn-helix transcriptional regulator [Nocardioides guangzhouensis]RYP88673.1 XRE family transcriptional regulator [Nocardioides guangzhouensis]
MGNERLRSQMQSAGITVGDLATEVDVDPKTVQRWLDVGRVPHQRHRQRTAAVLDSEEEYLWPELLDDPRRLSASQAEVLSLYPHRGAVPGDLWSRLLDQATECVDLLAYSGLFLLDSQPTFLERLIAKARTGLRTRVLLGDPEAPVLSERGREEGIGEQMGVRAQLSIDVTRAARNQADFDVRTHATPLYNSIYRFDDQALVNLHAYGWQAPQNPVLHLQRIPGGQLFDHYLTSFDRVWETGRDVV